MIRFVLAAAMCCASAAAHSEPSNNFLAGIRSINVVMHRDPPAEVCTASQYGLGDGYHGRRAADGSRFNTFATSPYTVAHIRRRLGSFVIVTNLANGRSIRAKVTDRGPFYHGRCVDLGRAGADAIGMGGTARVRVE